MRGYWSSEHLQEWRPVAVEWTTLIERYIEAASGDIPYCHSERTNVGLLATAAWRAGGVAVQEFLYEPNDAVKSTKAWGDLCVLLAGNIYLLEAKADWYSERGSLPEYRKRLEWARDDAAEKAKIPNETALSEYGLKRIAMVFSAPQLSRNEGTEKFDEKLERIRDLARHGELDLVVWTRPIGCSSNFVFSGKQEHWYPGIVLSAKVVAS